MSLRVWVNLRVPFRISLGINIKIIRSNIVFLRHLQNTNSELFTLVKRRPVE